MKKANKKKISNINSLRKTFRNCAYIGSDPSRTPIRTNKPLKRFKEKHSEDREEKTQKGLNTFKNLKKGILESQKRQLRRLGLDFDDEIVKEKFSSKLLVIFKS
jgi:hypothetical protein